MDQVHVRHHGFIHAGTVGQLILPTYDGTERIGLRCTMVSCTHLNGHTHETVIRFIEKIDPRNFVEIGHHGHEQSRDLMDLTGRVLLVEKDLAITRFFGHLLRQTRIELMVCAGDPKRQDTLEIEAMDAVFLSIEDMESGLSSISQIRRQGYGGPIIGIGTKAASDLDSIIKQIEVREWLFKPFTGEEALDLIWRLLASDSTATQEAGIVSTLSNDPSMTDLIRWYKNQLRDTISLIQSAEERRDKDELVRYCRMIAETAATYGYSPVGEVAIEAHRCLNCSRSADKVSTAVIRLKKMISLIR